MVSTRQDPEKIVERLATRLKRQKSWDQFLVVFPPLLAVLYAVFFTFYAGLMSAPGLWISIGAGLAALFGCRFFSRRGRLLSPRSAAALIDAKAQAQDRFITLATVEPADAPIFYDRLRKEARGLTHRINFRSDFPYRVKRSFLGSVAGSLILIAAFHALFHLAFLARPGASPVTELSRAARDLSQEARFADLARAFQTLIAKMEQAGLSEEEKAAVIEELRKKIEEQKKKDPGNDLLNRAENALRGSQKGDEERREDGKGGGLASNLPEEGEGKGKSRGGDGEGDDKKETALQDQDLKGEKSPQERGDEGKGQGEGKGEGESMKPQGETKREIEGHARKEMEGSGGKTSESEIPSGQAPQERFYKPGEDGEKGIKGARYVTVELPEVMSAESGSGEGEAKKRPAKSSIPVSNVPLSPATVPDLPREKQPLPLEYEGLIR